MNGWAKAKIEVFYLPPHSQELNLDKHLNNDLKYAGQGN